MNDEELIHHLSYAAKLGDYFMVTGQRNRLLVARGIVAANGLVGAPLANRVAVAVGLDLVTQGIPTTVAGVTFGFKDGGGNIVFASTIMEKIADVAAVTPSPYSYQPLFLDVTELGPVIQMQPFLTVSNIALTNIFVMELLFSNSPPAPSERKKDLADRNVPPAGGIIGRE